MKTSFKLILFSKTLLEEFVSPCQLLGGETWSFSYIHEEVEEKLFLKSKC
jgi:hypothetical protein